MLSSENMLPERSRNMRQMKDLLMVEECAVAEIESIVMDVYNKVSMLREELVNECWLEERLGDLVGGYAYAKKIEDALVLEIMLNVSKLTIAQEEKVIRFLEKWLPAHLSYRILYEKFLNSSTCFAVLWQDDEIMEMRQVVT